MIPKETVDLIIETARVEEVVGDFVSLKRRGVNLIGLCPFHNEKTPSFTVSPTKGIYKCFGCSAAGNSVNFVMEHDHVSYPEALRYLAKKYNITIKEENVSPEFLEQENERESLFAVTQFAQKYFSDNLQNSEEGQAIGLSYFKERGYSIATIAKFQLGYAFDGFDKLLSAAEAAGYKVELLEKTGLLKKKEDRYFDFFRSRVIFPIHNVTGKVIAFGARTLKSDKKEPKYLNSPETEIYVKSNILYGIFYAKKSIIANDNCFLVEGYTDVISLAQAGVENVVASSGTALTVGQIRLIKRYTPNITILYDGDSAGIKASFRGIDMILAEGMNVKVLLFPDGEDPDSYSKKVSTDELHQFIANHSKDFILFKTDVLLEEAQSDPIKKSALIRELLASVALVPDAITRSVYVKECSKMFEMTEQTLISELNKILRANHGKTNQQEQIPLPEEFYQEAITEREPENELLPQERDLVRILLNYGERPLEFSIMTGDEIGADGKLKLHEEILQTTVAEFIVFEMQNDQLNFDQEEFSAILNEYSISIESGMIPTQNHFVNQASASKSIFDLVADKYTLSKKWKDKHNVFITGEDDKLSYMVRNAVYSYKLKKVMNIIENIQTELKTNPEEEELNTLLQYQLNLLEVKKKLSAELGRVIIK